MSETQKNRSMKEWYWQPNSKSCRNSLNSPGKWP